MTKEEFTSKKAELIYRVEMAYSGIMTLSQSVFRSDLIAMIHTYNYENRLQKKGLLSRAMLGNLELDQSLSAWIIRFDQDIV